MGFLRKLFKWLLILLAIVAVAVLIVVWPVLGVNPFEGDADHLWELVSKDVHFFVRCAGTGTLETELAEGLADRPGYEFIEETRAQLRELTDSVRKRAKIPFDAVEVEFNQDFLAKEWAFAGTVHTDYSQPRADNFIFLTRIAYYGRFISALQRGFIRDKLPPELRDRIEPEKGYYVRVRLTPEELKALAPLRSVRPREDPDIVYVGRIKDVLLISDSSQWMDDAIKGRGFTLAADPWFETEFARNSIGEDSVEVFCRPKFSRGIIERHGESQNAQGALAGFAKVLPSQIVGEVALRFDPQAGGLALHFGSNPPPEGYKRLDPRLHHLRGLYEAEKGELHALLSENGIGRFIPSDDVVAAAVLCAGPDELSGLVLSMLSADERRVLEDTARGGGYSRGFERLFRDELTKGLGREHLVVLHRPSAFKNAPWHLYRDDVTPAEARLHITLVSRVRDNVASDSVRRTITKYLGALGLKAGHPKGEGNGPGAGADPSGRFHLAQPITDAGDLVLFRPAYGAIGQQKYVFFSTHVEAATAMFDAAEDEAKQRIRDPLTQAAVKKLPAEGTLALLGFGDGIADAMGDNVREQFDLEHDPVVTQAKRIRAELKASGIKNQNELDKRTRELVERYIENHYPEFQLDYRDRLAKYRAFDTIAFGLKLGIPPQMGSAGRGYAMLRPGEGDE